MTALSTLINTKYCISTAEKVFQGNNFTHLFNRNDTLLLEWRIINYKSYLYFKFNGILTSETSIDAINIWTEIVKREPNKISQIWDCTEMKAYEPKARQIWQKALTENHTMIDKTFLIASNSITKIYGQVISINTPIQVNVINKESELF